MSYPVRMSEYLYLALSAVVFVVGLIIGILLLRRAMREQIEYEQQLRALATGAPTATAGASAATAAPPVPPTPAAAPESAPAPPVPPAAPAPAAEGPATEADAKARVEAAKAEIEKMKGEGKDVSSADKLLQLATSCLYSGDFDRAVKYASKASKQIQDIKERGEAEKAPEGAAAAPAAEGEDPQQKEALGLISAVQAKIAGIKEESVEKSEVENLLRLATSFVRSKSYAKALRYAKQAEEKANALAK